MKCLACVLFVLVLAFIQFIHIAKCLLGWKNPFYFFVLDLSKFVSCSFKKCSFFSVFCSDHPEVHGAVHWQRIQVLVRVSVFQCSRSVEAKVLK